MVVTPIQRRIERLVTNGRVYNPLLRNQFSTRNEIGLQEHLFFMDIYSNTLQMPPVVFLAIERRMLKLLDDEGIPKNSITSKVEYIRWFDEAADLIGCGPVADVILLDNYRPEFDTRSES